MCVVNLASGAMRLLTELLPPSPPRTINMALLKELSCARLSALPPPRPEATPAHKAGKILGPNRPRTSH